MTFKLTDCTLQPNYLLVVIWFCLISLCAYRLMSTVYTPVTMKLSSTRRTATRRHWSRIFYRRSSLPRSCVYIHWHGMCIHQWGLKSKPVSQMVSGHVKLSNYATHANVHMTCMVSQTFFVNVFAWSYTFHLLLCLALPSSFSVPMTADDIKDILIPEYNDAGNYSDRQILTCPWHRKLG